MTSELQTKVDALLAEQAEHVMFPRLAVDWTRGGSIEGVWVVAGAMAPRLMAVVELIRLVKLRAEKIAGETADPFTSGIWPAAWHELLWEICRLRVANPGLPIEFLVGGANGSAKTYFAAAVVMWAMVRAPAGADQTSLQ